MTCVFANSWILGKQNAIVLVHGFIYVFEEEAGHEGYNIYWEYSSEDNLVSRMLNGNVPSFH